MEDIKEKDIVIDYQRASMQFKNFRLFGIFHCTVGPDILLFFPTTADMAINCGCTEADMTREDGSIIRIYDFRLVLDKLFSQTNMFEIFGSTTYKINPAYAKIYQKMRDYVGKLTVKDFVDKANEISKFLIEAFEHYLQFCSGDQDQLFENMTKTEEKALLYVLNTIGDQGIISISEAIRDSGISRPVFTSLFDKLNRYKGAEIRNMGVKGTYIDFYDHVMSKYETIEE